MKDRKLTRARWERTHEANRLIYWIEHCRTCEAKWDDRGRIIEPGDHRRFVGALPSFWPHYMDVLESVTRGAVRAARRLREIEGGPEL